MSYYFYIIPAFIVIVLAPLLLKNHIKSKDKDIIYNSRMSRSIFEKSGMIIIVWDTDGYILKTNTYTEIILGYTEAELKGKRWIDTIIPEKLREHMEDIGRKILDGKIIENHENEVLRKDGNSVYVLWNNTMIFDRNEKPLYIVSMGIDATQRREVEDKLESNFKVIKDYNKKLDTAHKKLNKQYVDLKVRKEELKESETRYRLATECANDAIWDWDITNNKIQFAGRWYEMLGYMKGDKTEINSWAEVLHPDEEKSVKEAIFKHLESKNECYIMEHRLRKKNGEYIWVLNRGKAIWNDDEPVRMAGAMTDITQKKTAENKIYKMAYYDHLTSLPNRRCLMKEIEKFIIESNEQDKMAFLYIDIDDFKKINDSLNHSTGDSILVKISERLKKNARLTGEDRVFLSHTSGDEFVFVLRQIKSKEEIIECCNNILKIFNKPYKLRGHTIHISCSIGISVYPDDGKSFDALFRNADMSMYRAKRSGRNNYCFYNRDMKKEAVQNLEMESEIRTALLNNEFEVYLQPQIDCKTDEVLKSEALIRWNHPVKGLVPPGDFIHIAEKTGQIIELGMWTLRKACEINKEIQTKHGINMIVSVNLSAWELQQSGLNLKIKEILDETGLFPEFLELEITESLAMQDPELAIKTLIKIRKMGIKVALDDFGTGYSSLNYLKILPITNLKIDKELIDDIVNNITEKNIVDFIIKLAHELNLEVTVEGVEDSKQYALIKGMECDRIQGYYISKPLTEKAFLNYIKNNQNKKGA